VLALLRAALAALAAGPWNSQRKFYLSERDDSDGVTAGQDLHEGVTAHAPFVNN